MDLVVQPSCQTPRPLLSPPRLPSSWVSPKSSSKAPELSLLQTPQVVKVSKFVWNLFTFIGSIQLSSIFIFDLIIMRLLWQFYILLFSAGSGLGGVRPRVYSLHPTVHSTQQPEAHTRGHPVCFPRALHHPPAAQQREPDYFHRRSRTSGVGEKHQMDQRGKKQHPMRMC